jgi:hypothetical protein
MDFSVMDISLLLTMAPNGFAAEVLETPGEFP